MGFFEEFGALVKKYNLEIHAVQVDENIKIMNERFRLALRKEDLPPPVFLLRTTEGDFIPSVFGPITINNEEHNITFINAKDKSTTTLFPIEVKKEEPVAETDKELTEEEAKQVVTTLNALGDALQNGRDWEEVPKVEEKKKPKKKVNDDKENYLIVNSLFDDNNQVNVFSSSKFIESHIDRMKKLDTLINIYITNNKKDIVDKGQLKLSSKEGKEVLKKIESKLTNFTKIILIDDYKKSAFAKRIVKDLEAKGIKTIKEKDF